MVDPFFFGVRNDGTVAGIEIGERTHDRIRGEIEKLDPPVSLELETIQTKSGLSILHVQVPGNTGVYRYDGRPYTRFGASTSIMHEETYQKRLLERWHSSTRWENQIAATMEISDLDHAEILRTVDEAIRNGRLSDPGTREVSKLLLGLGLLTDQGLLNAAAVLFGKSNYLRTWFPQCRLRLARFRGTSKADFVDNRQFTGHIFYLLGVAQQFLTEHIPISSRIVPNRFERVDSPLYPPEAVREALVNAFAHRDLAEASGGVDVAIFDDRMEIISTGGLRFGLTVEDLLRDHQSRPWNPIISQTLQWRGIFENWGRGTIRILELAEAAGIPRPEFEDRRVAFVVRFRSTSPASAGVQVGLSKIESEIISVLSNQGPSSISDLELQLSSRASRRKIQRVLQSLRATGLVTLTGTRRWARWSIVPDENHA